MKSKALLFSLVCASVLSISSLARAGDIALYAGAFNVNEHVGSDMDGLFGAEYRFDDIRWGLRPTVGASVDTSGDVYGYGGLNWDMKLTDSLIFTPNFMAGLYHRGSGEKLGGPIEFRSGLELSYMFTNRHRLGVAVNHMSNASIYDHNPGAENVLVVYSIPLR